jgi:hypothetical protein
MAGTSAMAWYRLYLLDAGRHIVKTPMQTFLDALPLAKEKFMAA